MQDQATQRHNEDGRVRRRRVFYIPGYDPIHPRRYRELYRKEGRAQAHISGYELSFEAKERSTGLYGWYVETLMDGLSCRSEVDVFVWSDIVQGSMRYTIAGTYAKLVRTAWTYIGSGALWRLMRLRRAPVLTALYPVGFLLLQLMLAICAGGVFGGLIYSLGVFLGVGQGAAALCALLLAAVPVRPILNWFRARDKRFLAYYLMHDYAYSARYGGENPPELETRMAEFVQNIHEALSQEDVDEVMIVGHSSGGQLGVSVLADVVRAGLPPHSPRLSFVTLGQVVPMISFLPRAHRLRRDLAFMAQQKDIAWLDVSAPGDVCCFALCDPVAVSGVAPAGKLWPLVISAAFSQSLSQERQQLMKGKWFRLHTQYLCAFDRPKDYDYFAITAGPMTLAARYAGRKPSKSRIETPVNGYTAL